MFFILDDQKDVVDVPTLEEWIEYFSTANRVVKQEYINKIFISTVFVGYGGKFETMIFDDNGSSIYTRTYETWDEALLNHKSLVREFQLKELL